MSRNPYLASARSTSSFTRSSRTSSRAGGLGGGGGASGGLLGRSRSSTSLGGLASQLASSSLSPSTYSGHYVPTSSWQRSSSSTRSGAPSLSSQPTQTRALSPYSTTRNTNQRDGDDEQTRRAAGGLSRSTSSHLLSKNSSGDNDDDKSQLKNYQQKKSNQPQPMRPSIKAIRSSSQSIDSDNASLENSENYSRATSRSATSLDSTASTATGNDGYDDSSIGDNIPSGSARHLRQQQQHQTSCLSKSKSLDISNKGSDGSNEVSMLFSTMSVDRLLLRADSMGERDLRKSFKELVMENERLKQQLKGLDDTNKQRHQEWIRKERQLQRKVSELEEENKEIEHWKQEIQRLKDENNSLIRVVSKLSKQR